MQKANLLIFSTILIFTLIFLVSFRVESKQKYDFCLKKAYESYKANFLSDDGRIIDYDKNNITTSEGQSYMLLQSLIMKDKKTFDLVWNWTKCNLQKKDRLFSWLWGKGKDGGYRILDTNPASDADVDIAFALILASEEWRQVEYLQEAIPIINSIWNNETKSIGNYLTLMPGVKQVSEEKIEINPSYFSTYAFKLFQKYDEIHDWNLLVDSSYYYLDKVMAETSNHLPPNWFLVNNNEIILKDSERSDFSYDAVRVFARIYLDYIETGDKRALAILKDSNFFAEQWEKNKTFYVHYQKNGQLRNKAQPIGSMAILIPAISLCNKKIAREMYENQIEKYFKNELYWSSKNDYYGKNLSWFAYYLYGKNFDGCGDSDIK